MALGLGSALVLGWVLVLGLGSALALVLGLAWGLVLGLGLVSAWEVGRASLIHRRQRPIRRHR